MTIMTLTTNVSEENGQTIIVTKAVIAKVTMIHRALEETGKEVAIETIHRDRQQQEEVEILEMGAIPQATAKVMTMVDLEKGGEDRTMTGPKHLTVMEPVMSHSHPPQHLGQTQHTDRRMSIMCTR